MSHFKLNIHKWKKETSVLKQFLDNAQRGKIMWLRVPAHKLRVVFWNRRVAVKTLRLHFVTMVLISSAPGDSNWRILRQARRLRMNAIKSAYLVVSAIRRVETRLAVLADIALMEQKAAISMWPDQGRF
jgi:hypothetical protein